jgi:hypothetical protein
MALFTKYHTFYYHQKNITNTQDLRRLLISYVKRRLHSTPCADENSN